MNRLGTSPTTRHALSLYPASDLYSYPFDTAQLQLPLTICLVYHSIGESLFRGLGRADILGDSQPCGPVTDIYKADRITTNHHNDCQRIRGQQHGTWSLRHHWHTEAPTAAAEEAIVRHAMLFQTSRFSPAPVAFFLLALSHAMPPSRECRGRHGVRRWEGRDDISRVVSARAHLTLHDTLTDQYPLQPYTSIDPRRLHRRNRPHHPGATVLTRLARAYASFNNQRPSSSTALSRS